MTDNVYLLETYAVPGFSKTVTDDGTGTDWIILNGTYPAFSNGTWGARITLGETSSYGVFYTQGSPGLTITDVTFIGQIENAQGGAGRRVDHRQYVGQCAGGRSGRCGGRP